MFMELGKVVIAAVVSLLALFLLTKLMGDKQLSELNMFDYIVGISIGSIAAEMAVQTDRSVFKYLVAMILYAVIATLAAILTNKSIKARRFIEGRTLLLYHGHTLYRENLKKARLDADEFLSQCRVAGYFDLNELEAALLEPNGKISFLPKSSYRPVNPQDLKLTPGSASLCSNVILDGKVMEQNLSAMGRNEAWLKAALKAQGIGQIHQVYLATCDKDGNLQVYKMDENKPQADIFQ